MAEGKDLQLLPLALDLSGRRCVCVGGGSVAARRVAALVAAGGVATVIAPELDPVLEGMVAAGEIGVLRRRYAAGDLAGAFIVLAATGIRAVDEAVRAEARALGALLNMAGETSRGDCQFMAAVRRGSLLVGLQTGGAAPAVTAALRARIEGVIAPDLEATLERLGGLRAQLRSAVPDVAERGARWRTVVDGGSLDAALDGGGAAVLARIEAILLGDAGAEE